MYPLLLLIAVLLGPLIYVVVTFTGKRPDSFSEYHYAGRTIDPIDFVHSTVMYALQVAAIVLFATWGFMYGFWVAWVPLFWAAGYFLVAKLLDKGHLDDFLQQDSIGTIHQFVAQRGKFRYLGALAALASFLGIAGPTMFEAEFGGQMVARLLADMGEKSLPEGVIASYSTLFFLAFLFISGTYMLIGGFRAVVTTDVYQLVFGFSGFSIALTVTLVHLSSDGNRVAVFALLLLLNAVTLPLLLYWMRNFAFRSSSLRSYLGFLALAVATSSFSCGLVWTLLQGGTQSESLFSRSAWSDFFLDQQFNNPWGMGLMPILSLLIANGLYQVVDIGQWQRLGAIRIDKEKWQETQTSLARTIRITGCYSAVSWFTAVIFGMALRIAVPEVVDNPYDAFMGFLLKYQSEGALERGIVLLIVASIVAILLSTVDSLAASITFTLHNDWLGLLSERWRTLTAARFATVVLLVISFIGYGWLQSRAENIADIIYCSWAFQIALFPLVLCALMGWLRSGVLASIALLAGMTGALVPVIWGAPLSPYSHSPFLALTCSTIVMAGNTFLREKDHDT